MTGEDIAAEMGDLTGEKGCEEPDAKALDEDFTATVVEGEDFTAAVVEGEDFTAEVVEGEDIIAAVGKEEGIIAVVVEGPSMLVKSSSSLSSLPAMSARWASFSCILAPATQWVSSSW